MTFSSRITSLILLFFVSFSALTGCEEGRPQSVESRQAAQTRAALAEADAQFGMPAVRNFREKKIMKELYELRDRSIQTYTYVKNVDGTLIEVCPSIGFGLPYATQYSSPEQHIERSRGGSWYGYEAPQAEPNGLYMPSSAEATWIICSTEGISAIYVEERVLVSTFQLRHSGTYFDRASAAAVPIDPSLSTLNEGAGNDANQPGYDYSRGQSSAPAPEPAPRPSAPRTRSRPLVAPSTGSMETAYDSTVIRSIVNE